MDKVYKYFRAEVKGVNEETGEVDMFIPVSAKSEDRDGEVIEPKAFEGYLPEFMKRPILLSSHDYRDLTNQIGEWSDLRINGKGMQGKPKYYINEGNEQADWGFKLASKGMAAFSVGFIPKVWEDGDGTKKPRRTYKEVELLEISQVTVPSNRDAIQGLRSKSVDPVMNQLLDDVIQSDYVQVGDIEDVPAITTTNASSTVYVNIQTDKGFTQEEIADEFEYILSILKENNLNDENLSRLIEINNEIKRITGGDIPDNIEPLESEPEVITYSHIQEAIKRIAKKNKTEE